MELKDKIKTIYSDLSDEDFSPRGTIVIMNNADGFGAFIHKWEHPTLPRPTDEQLGN